MEPYRSMHGIAWKTWIRVYIRGLILLSFWSKIIDESHRISIQYSIGHCDAMMHVLKDFINLKYSELLTEEISKSN